MRQRDGDWWNCFVEAYYGDYLDFCIEWKVEHALDDKMDALDSFIHEELDLYEETN